MFVNVHATKIFTGNFYIGIKVASLNPWNWFLSKKNTQAKNYLYRLLKQILQNKGKIREKMQTFENFHIN